MALVATVVAAAAAFWWFGGNLANFTSHLSVTLYGILLQVYETCGNYEKKRVDPTITSLPIHDQWKLDDEIDPWQVTFVYVSQGKNEMKMMMSVA